MSSEGNAKVQELIKDVRTCMLSTVDANGSIVSRPMTTQEAEFDGQLWFFAPSDSHMATEIARSPRVNVAYASGSSWVSVSGTASVVNDREKAHELWNTVVEAWFPEGPDDPQVVLVRVDAESAEYWDSPGGKVATVISLAKAKVTGKPYEGGENETVQF